MSLFPGSVKDLLLHAGVSGALAGASTFLLFPRNGQVYLPMFSTTRNFPLYQVAALVGVLTGAASTGLHYVVKEEIPLPEKANDMASAVLGAAAAGMAYTGGLYMLGGGNLINNYGVFNSVLTGASVDYVSSFLVSWWLG